MARPNSSYLKTLVENALRTALTVLVRLTGLSIISNALSRLSPETGATSTPGLFILAAVRMLVLAAVGLVCGLWGGFTGTSAALMCNQSLSWLIGLREPRLNAVSLIVSLGASLAAVVVFEQHKLADVPIAIVFAVASPVGALIGALPIFSDIRDSKLARYFWYGNLAAIGSAMLVYLHVTHASEDLASHIVFHGWIINAIASGLASGFYGRLSGTGPAIVIPSLIFIGHLGFLPALATALSIYALVSLGPALSYISKNIAQSAPVTWPTIGAIIGALIGAHFALKTPIGNLYCCFAVTLIALALIMISTNNISNVKTEDRTAD